MSNIDFKQNRRRIKREKQKKVKRLTFVILGILCVVSVSFFVNSMLGANDSAVADTANILKSDKDKTTYEDSVIPAKFSASNSTQNGFSEELLKYMKIEKNTVVYSDSSIDSKNILEIKIPEYVKYYGSNDGWAKISHKNITGYVLENSLTKIDESELKVIDGTLIVSKKYTVPKDFVTTFDEETESVMMVMIEAMKREGYNVRVGNRYLDSKSDVFGEESKGHPDSSNSELRTGLAVEFLNGNEKNNIDFSLTKESQWLRENAYKYGFILRYPEGKEEITGFVSNPKIYRFVGLELAKILFERNLTIEEYFN